MDESIKGLSVVTGEIVEINERAYQDVRASGDHLYTYVSSSTTHVKEIFLKTSDGLEKWFTWSEVDLPLRVGHHITVFCTYEKKNRIELFKVMNHATNSEWVSKELGLLRRSFKLLMLFLLSAPMLAWCSGFFFMLLGVIFVRNIPFLDILKSQENDFGLITGFIGAAVCVFFLGYFFFKDLKRRRQIASYLKSWRLQSADEPA